MKLVYHSYMKVITERRSGDVIDFGYGAEAMLLVLACIAGNLSDSADEAFSIIPKMFWAPIGAFPNYSPALSHSNALQSGFLR